MNKKISSLAGVAIVVVIAAIAAVAMYYQVWSSEPVAENNPTPTKSVSLTPIVTITPKASPISLAIINCGESLDCFIRTVQNCQKAKLLNKYIAPFSGIEVRVTYYQEIRGYENGLCVSYIKLLDTSLKYLQDAINELRSQGLTDNQIKERENEMNSLMREAIGKNAICKATTAEMVKYLTDQKEGNLSTLANQICEGTLYPK